jgi:hypothetical protein
MPCLQGHLRRVAEHVLRQRHVGEAVPDVADAELAGDLGRDVLLAEDAASREAISLTVMLSPLPTLTTCRRPARRRQGQRAGPRDVVHRDEVALLLAVLEHQRRRSLSSREAKIGQDAGVGVGQRLPRAVGVEEAQRDVGTLYAEPNIRQSRSWSYLPRA